MNEEQQDKQDFVVIHLSWPVTSSVIRAPYLIPTGQVKIILSKKRKSNKSKSDYKVGKKKINRVQEWKIFVGIILRNGWIKPNWIAFFPDTILSVKTTNNYFRFNFIVVTPLALSVCSLDYYLKTYLWQIQTWQRSLECRIHKPMSISYYSRKRCFELFSPKSQLASVKLFSIAFLKCQ